MKIAYKLTPIDWVNFQEYFRKKKAPMYSLMVPILSILLVFNIAFGIYMLITQGWTTYSWIFLFCILLLSYLLYLRSKARQQLEKAAEELNKKSPDIFGPMSMNFQENGLGVQSQKNQKYLSWEEMDKFDQTKDYFYLFSKKGVAYIIPKRDIEKESGELQAILDKHL